MKLNQKIETLTDTQLTNIAGQHFLDMQAGKVRPTAATRAAAAAAKAFPVGTLVEFDRWTEPTTKIVVRGTVTGMNAGAVEIQTEDGELTRIRPKSVRAAR